MASLTKIVLWVVIRHPDLDLLPCPLEAERDAHSTRSPMRNWPTRENPGQHFLPSRSARLVQEV